MRAGLLPSDTGIHTPSTRVCWMLGVKQALAYLFLLKLASSSNKAVCSQTLRYGTMYIQRGYFCVFLSGPFFFGQELCTFHPTTDFERRLKRGSRAFYVPVEKLNSIICISTKEKKCMSTEGTNHHCLFFAQCMNAFGSTAI